MLSVIYITSSEYYSFSGFKMTWSTSSDEDDDEGSLNGTILYLLVAFISLFIVTFLIICCLFLRKFVKSYFFRPPQVYVIPHLPNSSLDLLNASSDRVVSESELLIYSPRIQFTKKLVEVGDSVCSICFDE
mmetsp:Transcript_26444/g.47454  ORF Transcript_26444/g.47454 Transcript_26444/m.47454 type:complete len:131 (-) Transcript_26444:674-1066(-)